MDFVHSMLHFHSMLFESNLSVIVSTAFTIREYGDGRCVKINKHT